MYRKENCSISNSLFDNKGENYLSSILRSTFKVNFQILKTFKLKSQNTEEINLKLELVGVPDHDVKISFRGLE